MLFNINCNIFNILDIFYKYVKFWTIKKFVDRISFSTSTSKQCHPWFQFCLYSRAENTFYEEYIYLDTVERTGGINTTRPLRLLFLLETSNLSRLILEAKWASRKTGRVSTDWPTCDVRSQLEQKGGGGGWIRTILPYQSGNCSRFFQLVSFFSFFFFVERAESRVIDKSTAAYARSAISIGYLKATIG